VHPSDLSGLATKSGAAFQSVTQKLGELKLGNTQGHVSFEEFLQVCTDTFGDARRSLFFFFLFPLTTASLCAHSFCVAGTAALVCFHGASVSRPERKSKGRAGLL
jgi:hypothetical protein